MFAGCLTEPAGTPVPRGDRATFEANVQPVVDASCADPSCHGRPDRPLSLFSPRQYRADPSRTYLDEPLTDAELDANAREVAAFLVGVAVDDSLVLRKPLALAQGGCRHVGGEVFPATSDRRYRAIRSWLSATEAP
jgi:hypothetical protein